MKSTTGLSYKRTASDTSSGKRDTIASGWLTDVQKDWSLWAHGIDSRLYITGCEILEALHKIPGLCDSPAYGSCLVILGPAQCGPIRPSLKLLLVDLLNDSDFIACEFLTGEPVAEMPLLDFLANIYQPLLRNIQTDAGRMYGALNIPVSDMGLGLCLFEATPYSKDPMCVVDDSDWLTVWTSPGAITHPHMDHCGATQYFIHLFGHKIWLTWPPTERNLEFFGHLHRQRAYPDRMKKCLENLEGLQVFLANKPNTAFVLKPNTIHGCISISGSGHSGIRVWSLDHWKTSCRLMKWVIEWLYRQLGGPHTITEIVFDIEKLKDEIDQWKKIADKAGETHDKVHGMLQEIWAIETDVVHLDNVVNSMLTAENILAKHTVA